MEKIEQDIAAINEKLNQMMPVVAQTKVEVEQINTFIIGNSKFKIKGVGERLETLENWKWYLLVAVFLGEIGNGVLKALI